MSRYLAAVVLLAGLAHPAVGAAQAAQNATLRRAQQAYDNLEYRQVLTLARAALRERLTGAERARAYELLGFTYGAMDSILKAVDAFKQVVLIDPERQLDPNRVSPCGRGCWCVSCGSTASVSWVGRGPCPCGSRSRSRRASWRAPSAAGQPS